DLAGSRFSALGQINTSNVKSLGPRWLFQHGVIDGVSNQTTPVIADGTLYVTDSRGSVHAVDAADGHLLWTYDVTTAIGGGAKDGYVFRNRGVCYSNGVIYGAAGSFLLALDAKTGKPMPGFGKNGHAHVILDVLNVRYPDVTSPITLTLGSGTLKWHFQQTHHDVWDYDSANQPILFDMEVRGQKVKALAEASKNGYLYILNRETGQPIHPIKEMPVPTETTRSGEQPWPTQPIPYTAAGQPMRPVSPVFPVNIPPERLASGKLVPIFTPPGPNQIRAPGTEGGANYGPISYSPQTGLLYVAAVDSPSGAGRPARGYF